MAVDARLRTLALGIAIIPSCAPPAHQCPVVSQPTIIESSNHRFPLRISTDHHHLLNADGQPMFLVGDTAWSLIAQLSREDTELYLEDRRSRGFNAIVVNLLEHKFAQNAPRNISGIAPFHGPAFAEPCEEYFRHADWVLSRACEKGILVFLTYAYLGAEGGDEGWATEIRRAGVENCRRYGEFLGRRYAGLPNLIWMSGGDASPAVCGVTEEIQAMVEGIKRGGARQLHTAHSSRQRSAVDDFDASWLDINTTYSDCEQSLARLRLDSSRATARPFVFIEGRYENENASPLCLRAQAYWTLLAGGSGHIFGNLPVWGFGAGWEKGGRDWKTALDSAGARDMSRFAEFVTAWPLVGLRPDMTRRVLVDGPADAVLAFDDARSLAIAYLPTPRRVRVDLNPRPRARYRATWLDPTGARMPVTEHMDGQREWDLTPPGPGDWLLVIERAAQPAPSEPAPPAGSDRIEQ